MVAMEPTSVMICWALHDLLGATDPHLNDTHGRARGYVATSDDDERRDDVAGEAAVAVIAEDRQRGVVGLPHQERRALMSTQWARGIHDKEAGNLGGLNRRSFY